MSLLLKDPDAVLDYMVDWGAEYLGDDALALSRWSISPAQPSGARVLTDSFDELTAAVVICGGEAGKLYRISNHVVTVSGREDCRSFVLRVEAR